VSRWIGAGPVGGRAPGWERASQQEIGATRPSWLVRAPRFAILGWVILLILGLYMIRLWQLQFLEGGAWRARAVQQQSRLITVSPPRGVIYDRNNRILVRNVPAYDVTVTPGHLPADAERQRDVLMRLAQLLDVPYSTSQGIDLPGYRGEIGAVGRSDFPTYGSAPAPGLREMVETVRYVVPFAPIVVSRNVDRDLAMLIAQESGVTMPGVDVDIVSRRRYGYGEMTSQVLGFLGPIPAERVGEFEQKGYNPAIDRIGYAGIEAQLEESLRGIPGRRVVERDVLGKELGVLSEAEPSPGDNVYLTLDIELQAVAEAALADGLAAAGSRRGVVILMDPRDGQVLAIVSLPTYDNNMFSRRLDIAEYERLLSDPHRPFINHAIADQVPPGSIFKIVPAAAALQEGVINRFTTIGCQGRMYLPNRFAPDDPTLAQPFYCWIDLQYGHGHGPLNVVDALAQSCDIFFYQVGGGFEPSQFVGLGVDRLAAYATAFGLGSVTGIDIPGEAAGLVPTPQWKRQVYQETWTTGNTYNLAIGQGDLLATPLQMVNAMAVVANGGFVYQPQLIHHVVDATGHVIRPFSPIVRNTLDIDEAVWQIVREGLDIASSPGGTGSRALLDELGINLAGKTGTAEYCDDIAWEAGMCDVAADETLPTHAWYMAYGPVEQPEVVALAWVYDGGEGSTVAAPIVREVLDFYFRRELGLLDQELIVPEVDEPLQPVAPVPEPPVEAVPIEPEAPEVEAPPAEPDPADPEVGEPEDLAPVEAGEPEAELPDQTEPEPVEGEPGG
jgi:penicillin-binding protein 2